MKSLKMYLASVGLLIAISSPAQTTNVKIAGSMKALRVPHTEMTAINIATDIFPQKVAKIVADTAGMYTIELFIEQPGYYEISHTLFYLSPKDEMEANLGIMPKNSKFAGNGEEIQRFLNKRANMDSWFLFGTRKIPSFSLYKAKTDSAVNERRRELEQLKNTDKYFHETEIIRLKAQTVNLYLSYFSSTDLFQWDDSEEVKLQKKQIYYKTIVSTVEPLLKELTTSDRYLNIPEVREVLNECYTTQVFHFPQSPTFLELVAANKNKNILDTQGINQDEYNRMSLFAKSIKERSIQQAFTKKLELKSNLIEGNAAIDLELEDLAGKKSKLSDLKGKAVYLDFWATWCLPCLAQKPLFEKLSAEYPEIQFISISIDMDISRWRAKLEKSETSGQVKEYRANPYVAGDAWDIHTIPRFILIDKEFNIISGTAPRPSDTENIKKLLDQI